VCGVMISAMCTTPDCIAFNNCQNNCP
jgi:hypothetical protein